VGHGREETSPSKVVLIAETADVVIATGGLKGIPDDTTADCPPLDAGEVRPGRSLTGDANGIVATKG
jgi:hypothetical protein